jgi:hypothetical protein
MVLGYAFMDFKWLFKDVGQVALAPHHKRSGGGGDGGGLESRTTCFTRKKIHLQVTKWKLMGFWLPHTHTHTHNPYKSKVINNAVNNHVPPKNSTPKRAEET